MKRQTFIASLLLASMCGSLNLAGAQVNTPVQQQPAAQASVQAQADTTNPALTGQVQAQAQAPQTLTAADFLDIQAQPGTANYKYQEYSLSLQNKQPKHVELLQIEVTNGLNEQSYVQLKQEQSQSKRRAASGMIRGLGGLASIASGFIPYAGVGSYAAYQGINAGTSVAYHAANMVDSTSGAPVTDYNGRILQRATNIVLGPNQQFQCLAVVPEKQAPVVKIIFKDLQTNQIYDLQH